jgi:UDPglucose 6-dehydrogenase
VRVVVIGTGHVGLVTCGSLAAMGHDVVGTDSDHQKIESLQEGVMPFHEPGLAELVEAGKKDGLLSFTIDPKQALGEADVVFICVSTPSRASGEANLVGVEESARQVANAARGRTVVVEKSTVPAGTAQRVGQVIALARGDESGDLAVVSNPEFLREGQAVHDAMHPDRILVGAESDWAFDVMRSLYQPLIEDGCRIIETDINTAELAKHASNAFLALKVSFANALARVCERAEADVVAIADVMGSDPRIGRAFLDAGLGYGGSCFPKDLQAFDRLAERLGYDFRLLREIARINDEAVEATVEKIRDAIWNLEGKRIALLGMAFKPGTDDIRFSPAVGLARRLLEEGATVVGYDPAATANVRSEVPEIEMFSDPYQAATGAHCVVFCTDWDEFRQLDLKRLKQVMTYLIVVDGRNLADPIAMKEAGFTYYPTGRARPWKVSPGIGGNPFDPARESAVT